MRGQRAGGTAGAVGAPGGGTPGGASARQILSLALPALGALAAEPVLVMIDSAVVGHLGTGPLAGLASAGTLLTTATGLCVFLAYATTATVARLAAGGRREAAARRAVDGLWLALVLGLVLAAAGFALAGPTLDLVGVDPAARPYALQYLRWSLPGLPFMLAVLAANGALRGLHDTVSTLRVAVAGAAFNAVASVALVYGAGLGIAGSGLATALAQTGMAVALTVRVARSFGPGPGASDAGRPGTAWPGAPRGLSGGMWRPRPRGIARAARAGGPLFARTVFLRVAILATMSAAAGAGEVALAAHQVVMSVMNFAAMAADALEIAGQVLMAEALGRAGPRDRGGVRVVARRLCLAGLIAGLGAGVVVAALAWVFPALFSDVAAVRAAARLPLLMCAAGLPVAGVAFLTDGLLVGAERGGYLAVASAATLAAYLPALAWAAHSGTGPSRLVWVWLAYGVWYMVARVVAGLAGTRWAVVARR